jgi:Cu(I)/Ag(I) efflux system membrane fusion protein
MSRAHPLASSLVAFALVAVLSCSGEPGERAPAAASEPQTDAAAPAAASEISHWTCPMHPSVHAKHAGKCPICGMELVAVTRAEVESGEIRIDAERRKRVGIRTERVTTGPLELMLRAAGRVVTDETALVDVSLKVRGWVGRLEVDALGAPVKRGETLFFVYGPELYAAQQELLQAKQSAGGGARSDAMLRAARKRLELFGIAAGDVDAISARGEAKNELPIRAPASGYVIEKNVVAGGAVEPGARLYRIAPLDRVWVEASLQESELPLVAKGQPVRVALASLPGERFEGTIAYVHPALDPDTRKGRIRVELPNPGERLLPGMFVDVELVIARGEKLLVPASAVIYAGPRRVVFVDLGDGRLAPRTVEIGAGNGDVYEVLSGLAENELVVTSGNFLVAAESRLKSAVPR